MQNTFTHVGDVDCRLRDRTDVPRKLVNKEYARLTGDPPVEAGDGDGGVGSGDEGGKKTPDLSRILQCIFRSWSKGRTSMFHQTS